MSETRELEKILHLLRMDVAQELSKTDDMPTGNLLAIEREVSMAEIETAAKNALEKNQLDKNDRTLIEELTNSVKVDLHIKKESE